MPTFNFQCIDNNCKHEFSQLLSMNTKKTECLKCGKEAVKLLSPPQAIHLKGSGFYINDSKDVPKTTSAKPSGPSSDSDKKK